jgi:hypothetical protein
MKRILLTTAIVIAALAFAGSAGAFDYGRNPYLPSANDRLRSIERSLDRIERNQLSNSAYDTMIESQRRQNESLQRSTEWNLRRLERTGDRFRRYYP